MNTHWLNSAAHYGPRELRDDPPSSGGASPPSGGAPAPTPPSPGGGGTDPVAPGSAPDSGGAGDDTSSSSQADAFAGFEDDLDEIDLGVVAPGTQPGATPPTPAPAQAAPVPAATPASGTPPAPVQPQAAPASDGSSAPKSKLEAFNGGFEKPENIQALANWAAENPFKLSKEDAEALDTDAAAHIPKLMGRVYAECVKSIGAMLHNFTPELVQSQVSKLTSTTQRAAQANSEFFATHPELNQKDHQAIVDQWAKVYRQMNPKASRQEAIKFVGNAVKTQLGIQPGSAPPGQRPAPFVPARPGGGTAHNRTPQGEDPYAGLDFDFDEG